MVGHRDGEKTDRGAAKVGSGAAAYLDRAIKLIAARAIGIDIV